METQNRHFFCFYFVFRPKTAYKQLQIYDSWWSSSSRSLLSLLTFEDFELNGYCSPEMFNS